MSENKPTTTGKPFLRALKLAAKVHKEGGSVSDAYIVLDWAERVPEEALPSAAQSSVTIVAQLYNNLPVQTTIDTECVGRIAAALGCEVRG